MDKYEGRWFKKQENGVLTHGSTQPILTVLDVGGFELRDMVVIGINDNCGSIILPSHERVCEARAVLEPAYAVSGIRHERGDWWLDYDRRRGDGSTPNWFVTEVTFKQGKGSEK